MSIDESGRSSPFAKRITQRPGPRISRSRESGPLSRSVGFLPDKKKPGVPLAETPGRRVKVADERGEPYKQFRQPPKLSVSPDP